MSENKHLTKFEPEDYIKGDSLIAEHQGHISICGDVITLSHLEFDEKVKINTNSLVLSKDETYKNMDKEIYLFKGKNDDGKNFNVKFENMSYVFSGCKFNSDVHLNLPENCTANIDSCVFEQHFYINDGYRFPDKKIDIYQLRIQNSTFQRDFSVYKACIKNIEIYNVDFESLSEFNEVEFKGKFNLHEITYKGFTLFDKCIFDTKVEFEYIVFEKFTSFRGSIFNKGLNLEYTSSDKEINFYGIEILDKTTTSQETYRIIKNQFEKLNNKIEANKYHALELEQHRKDIKTKILTDFKSFFKFAPDGLVSLFHWTSSNHSSNWFLALFWIFIVSFCTNVFLGNTTIDFSLYGWNNLFKYINILSKIEDFNDSYIAMTLNKVSLGYLYYQFLTAVRKDTRK